MPAPACRTGSHDHDHDHDHDAAVGRLPARLDRRGAGPVAVALALFLLLSGCLGGSRGPTAAPTAGPRPTGATVTGARALPFDLPSAAVLQAAPRQVFAHYFPPLPVSLDNKAADRDYYAREYLDPNGEDGKHARYGGHLRDRPLPRGPVRTADWRLHDMRSEVRQALAGGLDGFTVDIIQDQDGADPRLWENVQLLLRAADQVGRGFRIVLMPDMSGSLAGKDPAELADAVSRLSTHASAYRLTDGRLLVSPFKAEEHSAQWWKEFTTAMRERHDTPVALLPVFLDERPHVEEFRDISYGLSNWGARNPAYNAVAPALTRIDAVHSLGLRWMQPVSVQDERPASGIYDEAQNTTNLRRTWRIARESGAELVQVPTWNDYTEGTQLAPSLQHGWSYLDVNAYYLTWYKTGKPPPIVRDTVVLTHRTQTYAARTARRQPERMRLRGGSPPRDTVEALTFLREPGTVTISAGEESKTCQVSAGVDTCVMELAPGRVQASVERGGRVVTAVESPYRVVRRPVVQDLQYVAVSSGRTPAP